ncbi:CrcB family protein [Janibacter sp. DB-40]|uniref:fluoride efflux transporter FluC n=1 Tax=Janibacter sp. DB-40 TaxID=3028808 RepID=UPI00240603EF|nr:CrcB family protein [Janibacter sp. DB-40]
MTEGGTRLAVAAGGAVGTLGRWLVDGSLPEAGPGWGWATLTVNVTGALAMGLLVAWLAARVRHSLVRPFAAVGLLGGWTTYSTFVLDAHAIIGGDGLGRAVGYVLATLLLGVGASLGGLLAGERWFGVSPERADRMVEEEEL